MLCGMLNITLTSSCIKETCLMDDLVGIMVTPCHEMHCHRAASYGWCPGLLAGRRIAVIVEVCNLEARVPP